LVRGPRQPLNDARNIRIDRRVVVPPAISLDDPVMCEGPDLRLIFLGNQDKIAAARRGVPGAGPDQPEHKQSGQASGGDSSRYSQQIPHVQTFPLTAQLSHLERE
jgi:hypothetical protein